MRHSSIDHQFAAPEPYAAIVCVPTFRRPAQLRLTLESLARQRTRIPFGCLIVENDAEYRAGAEVANGFLQRGALRGLCVLESRRGNCNAINKAFDVGRGSFATARYFLMIDDDEVAADDWLECLVDAAERTGADIAGGPVFPRFESAAAASLADHPAFRPAYAKSGWVPMIYGTGNCLVRRTVFDRLDDAAFDLRFNFLGGGDTDFFARCRRAGFTFYWEQAAAVFEAVPPRRTQPAWLAARSLRIGAINYLVDRKGAAVAGGGVKVALKTMAILGLSLIRTSALLASRARFSIAVHPLLVACGRILAGLRLAPEQYRNPERN
jgi:glycosyltransferase involved in cell wall biosynthesis